MSQTQTMSFAHLLASSPFHEGGPVAVGTGGGAMTSASSPSPVSPGSEAPRYFGEREYDDSIHSYSSPPSSVPSVGHSSSFISHPFPAYHHPHQQQHQQQQQHELCSPDASFGYHSSPIALQQPHHYMQHLQTHPELHLQHPHVHANQQQQQQHQLAYHLPPPPMMESSLSFSSHDDDVYNHAHSSYPLQAPRAAMIPGFNMDRPEPKRRKTCPEITTTTSSPTKRARQMSEKRGAGKDGEDVWPEDVETAFFEATRLVPKLGRKKIVVNTKPCGRNELIGDYIRRKTGRIRSRKQVSSHIQVLKNIRKHDFEFLDLVSEPKPGEAEEDFTPEARVLFFAPQEYAHITPENAPPEPPISSGLLGSSSSSSSSHLSAMSMSPAPMGARDGLLSPYCGNNFFSLSSSSSASSPALSSSACSTRSVSPYPLSTVHTPSGGGDDFPLSSQVFQMKLAPPSPAVFSAITNPAHAEPAPPHGAIKGHDVNATPKSSPSKLGHRRVASRGLALTIPPNLFGQPQGDHQQQQGSNGGQGHSIPTIDAPAGDGTQGQPGLLMMAGSAASNPSTPWPQMLHTPTCPPPAPAMLPSPTQRHRLTQIWASSSADWNKASPALDGPSFEHELAAAVASSKNMQTAAARSTVPMKRSNTDVGFFNPHQQQQQQHQQRHQKEAKLEHALHTPAKIEDSDNFFSALLGSRDF